MTHCYQRLKRMGSVGLLLLAFGCAGFTTQDEMPELQEFYRLINCNDSEEICHKRASNYLNNLFPTKKFQLAKEIKDSENVSTRCLGLNALTMEGHVSLSAPGYAKLIANGSPPCFRWFRFEDFYERAPGKSGKIRFFEEIFQVYSNNFNQYNSTELEQIEKFSRNYFDVFKIRPPFNKNTLDKLIRGFKEAPPELQEFYILIKCGAENINSCYSNASIYSRRLPQEKQLELSKILIQSDDSKIRCTGLHSLALAGKAEIVAPGYADYIARKDDSCFFGALFGTSRFQNQDERAKQIYKEIFKIFAEHFQSYNNSEVQNIQKFSKGFLKSFKIETPFGKKALEELTLKFQSENL